MSRVLKVTSLALALAIIVQLATQSSAESPQKPADRTEPAVTEKKADQLFRHADYPAAWTASQESNRPILVYVTMPRCSHCVKMIEDTYKQPEVGKMIADSFETICADRYAQAKLVEKLNVKWYPTTILVASNNKVLDVIEGYVDANSFKRRLQLGLAASSPNQTR